MTRRIFIGNVPIGGGAPIAVQSMTNTRTSDVAATVAQIEALQAVGCEIARVAVPDLDAARALPEIKRAISIPLVADVHFDPALALAAIEAGVDKLRLNPGNITDPDDILRIAEAAKEAGIPIRVGANSGSLAKAYLDRDGRASARGMVDSAMNEVRLLERLGFDRIVISLKGTDVETTVEANRTIAEEVDYPLHIGITEAGTPWDGAIRSSVGLGILLREGIGDTIRVSLAGDPTREVRAAYSILRSLGLRRRGSDLRVCPTCGRTGTDLVSIAERIGAALADVVEPLKIAVMGCEVNGPGEVREADVGLLGGKGCGVIYVDGTPATKSIPEDRLVDEFVRTVRAYAAQRETEEANDG